MEEAAAFNSEANEFKVGDKVGWCITYGERLSGGVTTVIDSRYGTIVKISASNAVVNGRFGNTTLPISKLRKVQQVTLPKWGD
jgi:hypothetical protein